MSAPVQWSTPIWLELREARQKEILERIASNLGWLVAKTRNSPCRVPRVEGGWSAVVEVPRLMPEEELVLELLDRDGVLVHPGYFFDFPREGFLVISLLPESDVFRRRELPVCSPRLEADYCGGRDGLAFVCGFAGSAAGCLPGSLRTAGW